MTEKQSFNLTSYQAGLRTAMKFASKIYYKHVKYEDVDANAQRVLDRYLAQLVGMLEGLTLGSSENVEDVMDGD